MKTILEHINKYPLLKERDLVKLLYQRNFGPGHLISNENKAIEFINEEIKLTNNKEEEYEELGNNVYRIYLSTNTNSFELAKMMIDSTPFFDKEESKEVFLSDCEMLKNLIISNKLNFDLNELEEIINLIKENDYAPISHSKEYNLNYKPHYRVVKSDCYNHTSVLLNEAVDYLNIKEDGIYVDMTLGGGGHSSLILSKLKKGHLYSFDADEYAIKKAYNRLSKINDNFTLINSNFVNIKEELIKHNVSKVDGIIYDLGVSSFQFDTPSRGFSYRYDAKLDMRMDQNIKISAKDIVNTYSHKELSDILYKYGGETYSFKIADKIIDYRKNKVISTTFELVDIIKSALPQRVLKEKGHPCKKSFQALRIAVNDELNVFEKSLNQALDLLNSDGRIVVISFHSLEDRICKYIFNDVSKIKDDIKIPIMPVDNTLFELVSKKAILPSKEEIQRNNRSKSAKMRVIRRK